MLPCMVGTIVFVSYSSTAVQSATAKLATVSSRNGWSGAVSTKEQKRSSRKVLLAKSSFRINDKREYRVGRQEMAGKRLESYVEENICILESIYVGEKPCLCVEWN